MPAHRRSAVPPPVNLFHLVHPLEAAAVDLGSLYAGIHRIISGLLAAKNFYIALLDPETELISFPYFVDELAGLL